MSGANHPPRENIEVEVERLEFDGIVVREPARVEAAFVDELEQLLQSQGLPERSAERLSGMELDGGALSRADFETPERLGRAVAHRVYRGLRG